MSIVELWDETLREGAERSPLSPTVEDKVRLAVHITAVGLRTLLVGMFPDVPHNVALLDALLAAQVAGDLPDTTRFIVISHLGVTLDETRERLLALGRPLDNVGVLAIHSASDQQIEHLYPVIRAKDPSDSFDAARWATLPVEQRRAENADWLAGELKRVLDLPVGRHAVGLLDAFRSDLSHLTDLAALVAGAGVRTVRLVDTAGTATPGQTETLVRTLTSPHPGVSFYGHFHDDFGMATANALIGLQSGLRGVDVSVGGFANRAGHPALAEVVMALRLLWSHELPGFRYDQLFALSRTVEKVYGLAEKATQPLTGVATHGISAGIRTQLVDRAPTIFDVIDPATVGATLDRSFGVRSGTDGVRRFLADNAESLGIPRDRVDAMVDPVYTVLTREWERRTATAAADIAAAIDTYHRRLRGSILDEAEMADLVREHVHSGGVTP